MGVDARMYIPSDRIYSEDELIKLSYRLGEATDPHHFCLYDENSHALEIEDTTYGSIAEYNESFKEAKQIIDVNLMGRYYGPGYERGNLWDYIAIAVWIEKNMNVTPWYGGDSDMQLELFDENYRQELINHWTKSGGIPYRDRQERHQFQPTCPRCKVLATQFGYGVDYAAWTCLGCGKNWNWNSKDGVVEGKKQW
jgi:hypothetical protein